MATLVTRNVPDEVADALSRQAAASGMSREQFIRTLYEVVTTPEMRQEAKQEMRHREQQGPKRGTIVFYRENLGMPTFRTPPALYPAVIVERQSPTFVTLLVLRPEGSGGNYYMDASMGANMGQWEPA